jgi:hypothetical protein
VNCVLLVGFCVVWVDMEQVAQLFYTGNLQACISKGEGLVLNEEQQRVERDVFVHRAFILQNRAQIVVDEISEGFAFL